LQLTNGEQLVFNWPEAGVTDSTRRATIAAIDLTADRILIEIGPYASNETRFVNVTPEKPRHGTARPLCLYERQVQHVGQLHLPRLGGSPS